MKSHKLEKKFFDYTSNYQDFVIGSMIAFCFIMLPILPFLDQEKTITHVASYPFALYIPSLIFYLLIKRVFSLSKSKSLPISCILIGIVGLFSTIAGMISILYYVLHGAAIVFIISVIVCFNFYYDYEEKVVLSVLRKKEQSQKKPNKIYMLREAFLCKINKILSIKIKASYLLFPYKRFSYI